MNAKTKGKNAHKGKPIQLYVDDLIKVEFEALIKAYDPLLSTAGALKKLISWAITEYWLPGYIRKGEIKGVIENELARAIPYLDNRNPETSKKRA